MNAEKKTLSCTLPDGSKETRTTKHQYTHVCAVFNQDVSRWGALSWHHNETAARKELSGRWGKIYPTHKIVAVDATVPAQKISNRNQIAAAFWGVDLSVIPTEHIHG